MKKSAIIIVCIFFLLFFIYKLTERNLITTVYIWSVIIFLCICSIFVKWIRYPVIFLILIYRTNTQFLFGFFNIVSQLKMYKIDNIIARNLIICWFDKNFKVIHNFENIPSHPTIFLYNYVNDRIENVTCIMIPTHICPVIGLACLNFYKKVINPCIIIKKGGHYDVLREEIRKVYDKGISTFVYVEKVRLGIDWKKIGKIHTGVFKIAKELNITITPIVFDRIFYDKFYILKYQNYQIRVGDTFHVDDVQNSIYKTRRFFQDNIDKFKKTKFFNIY